MGGYSPIASGRWGFGTTRSHAPGVGQGRAVTTIRPTIWDHCRHTNLVRIVLSLRADMIFGKDSDHLHGEAVRDLGRTAFSSRCRPIAGSPRRRLVDRELSPQ